MASSNSLVSQEEFKIFHNIDRMLYTRLVVNLERDPEESMHVMGFWIWLERAGHVRHFVNKMLPLPDSFINSMAEEALLCLKSTQDEHFLRLPDIPLLHNMSDTGLSLPFFHENGLSILGFVSEIVNKVCSRAFQDISAQVETLRAAVKAKVPICNNSQNVLPLVYGNYTGSTSNHDYCQYEGGHFGNFIYGDDIGDMLNRIQICTGGEEEKDGSSSRVPADDRTIFLTFSKGYPIIEQEIRDFFSRKYGECIEAIHMQDVTIEEHQPLYARLVVPSLATIKMILGGNMKMKFSINGKHVWARKYVRKNPKSLPESSSPSLHRTSPSA